MRKILFSIVFLAISFASIQSNADDLDYMDDSINRANTVESLIDLGVLNARQIPEGFFMFGLQNFESGVSVDDANAIADEFVNLGIRGIIGFEPMDADVIQALNDRGIRLFSQDTAEFNSDRRSNFWWFGNRFWFGHALTWLQDFNPHSVAIHCTHGVDRTGNAVAFILATQYGWSIQDALYAVAYNSQATLDGISDVLLEFGIEDYRYVDDESVSIYGFEGHYGMKAYTEGYKDYIRLTIRAMLEYGGDFITGC